MVDPIPHNELERLQREFWSTRPVTSPTQTDVFEWMLAVNARKSGATRDSVSTVGAPPSFERLERLPARAFVAVALRCAHRVGPLLRGDGDLDRVIERVLQIVRTVAESPALGIESGPMEKRQASAEAARKSIRDCGSAASRLRDVQQQTMSLAESEVIRAFVAALQVASNVGRALTLVDDEYECVGLAADSLESAWENVNDCLIHTWNAHTVAGPTVEREEIAVDLHRLNERLEKGHVAHTTPVDQSFFQGILLEGCSDDPMCKSPVRISGLSFPDSHGSDSFVYHYTSWAVATSHLIPEGRLRFNPRSLVNDPLEARISPSLSLSHAYASLLRAPKSDNRMSLSAWRDFSSSFTRSVTAAKILCFSMDHPDASQAGAPPHLRRGFGRMRMWHHYGDGHSGVCLVFDRGTLDALIRRRLGKRYYIHGGPVLYTEHVTALLGAPEADEPMSIESTIDRHSELVFFRKSEDWGTEQEYRWVLTPRTDAFIQDWEFVEIRGALRGVILGMNASEGSANTLRPFTRTMKVPLFQVALEDHAADEQSRVDVKLRRLE